MAKYIVFSQTTDNYVSSANAAYATARAGGGTLALGSPTGSSILVGQTTGYTCYEGFISFDTSMIPSTEQVSSTKLTLQPITGPGVNGSIYVYPSAWNAPVQATDFVAGASLPARVGSVLSGPAVVTGAALSGMIDDVVSSSSTNFLLASNRMVAGTIPTSSEVVSLQSADVSGTASDPVLAIYTSVRSCLTTVGNSLAQTSTGTWVSMRSDGAATPVITLYSSTDGDTWTSIATVPTGTTAGTFNVSKLHGHQVLSMCLDSSDNIYVVGFNGDTHVLAAKAYTKTPGVNAWTAKALVASAESVAGTQGSALVVAWVPSTDHICVAQVHPFGGSGSGVVISNLSASVARAGTGTPLFFESWTRSSTDLVDGAGVCIFGPDATARYVTSAGVYGLYDLFSGVNYTSYSHHQIGPAAASGQRNGEEKVRAVRTSGTTTDLFYDDSAGSYANSGCFAENQVMASSYSSVHDAATGNTTQKQPANSKVSKTLKWDVFYDPTSNRVWLYYLDTTDSRKLHRTSYSLASSSWIGDDASVSNAVGAAGSTNLAVRCVLNPYDSRSLVEIANVTSGGVHSVISIVDVVNVAPFAPTLSVTPGVDLTDDTTLSWVFNDVDPHDTQSAYQVEVSNYTTGVTAVNTGKVTSDVPSYVLPANTFTSGADVKWRCTNWDSWDLQGPASEWKIFPVSAKPSAVLLSPSAPLTETPVGYYDVAWTYIQAGSLPQKSYQVVLVNTDDGSVFYDSGVVNSSAVTHRVTDLLGSVVYAVTVTVVSAKDVSSSPVTQTLVSTYATPDTPTIVVTAVAGGMQIAITNPTPTGSNVLPTHNQLWSTNVGNNHDVPDGSPGYQSKGGYYLLLDNIPINTTVYDYGVVSGAEAGGPGKAETYFVRAVS